MELEIYVIEKLKGQRKKEIEMNLGIRKIFNQGEATNATPFSQPLLKSLPTLEGNCCPVEVASGQK